MGYGFVKSIRSSAAFRFGETSVQLCRTSRSCVTFLDQRVPVIGRMPGGEHFGEDSIRVVLCAVGTLGVFIVHPAQRDDLALNMEPKEQPILHEELCPKPMFVFRAQCVALVEFGSGGIARDVLEHELGDRRKSFRGVF